MQNLSWVEINQATTVQEYISILRSETINRVDCMWEVAQWSLLTLSSDFSFLCALLDAMWWKRGVDSLSLSLSLLRYTTNKTARAIHSENDKRNWFQEIDEATVGQNLNNYRGFINICDLACYCRAKQFPGINDIVNSSNPTKYLFSFLTLVKFSCIVLSEGRHKHEVEQVGEEAPRGQVRDGATDKILLLHNSLSWQQQWVKRVDFHYECWSSKSVHSDRWCS